MIQPSTPYHDTTLPICDVYKCIQGEGRQTGTPMTILRLMGCDVACFFCDTKFTWDRSQEHRVNTIEEALGANERWTEMTALKIAEYLKEHHAARKWVLVTGGEPAQYNLKPLVTALHAHGFKVALETSGTEIGHVGAGFDWVCCSPKINNPGKRPLHPEAVLAADEVKFVIGKKRDIEIADAFLRVFPVKEGATLSLQPMSVNPKATALCVETCEARDWNLSIQVHQLLNLP